MQQTGATSNVSTQRRNGTGSLVGISEAARLLGKNKSTISRYVASHEELNRGTSERPLVDVDELAEHRSETLNIAMSGNAAGRFVDEAEDEEPVGTTTPGSPKGLRHWSTEAKRLEVRRKQREDALAEGALAPVQEIFDGHFEIGGRLRERLTSGRQELAERLCTMTDVRAIEALLDEDARELIAGLDESLQQIVERYGEPDDS